MADSQRCLDDERLSRDYLCATADGWRTAEDDVSEHFRVGEAVGGDFNENWKNDFFQRANHRFSQSGAS